MLGAKRGAAVASFAASPAGPGYTRGGAAGAGGAGEADSGKGNALEQQLDAMSSIALLAGVDLVSSSS